MDPVQITPQASQDIAKLAQGVERALDGLRGSIAELAQVALDSLRRSELSPAQVKQLEALLKMVSPTEGAASATKSEAVAEFKLVDGHEALVGKISVNGQQLDTLLSSWSFNKTRRDQVAYAERLGYRFANREEHRTYVDGLLAKEADTPINEAEERALETYREAWVRDTEGGLKYRRGRVRSFKICFDAYPAVAALFVRASAESK